MINISASITRMASLKNVNNALTEQDGRHVDGKNIDEVSLPNGSVRVSDSQIRFFNYTNINFVILPSISI